MSSETALVLSSKNYRVILRATKVITRGLLAKSEPRSSKFEPIKLKLSEKQPNLPVAVVQ